MNEKESFKVSDKETTQSDSHVKEVKRYSSEKNKKPPRSMNERQDYDNLEEKNKDDNSNLTLTEDKATLA